MKIFASNFTDRLIQEPLSKRCKIRSKEVVKGLHDLLFKVWDPSISSEWLYLETSNLANEGR